MTASSSPDIHNPIIDPRDRYAIYADLRRRLAGYTPGWEPAEGTAGAALHHVFARFTEIFLEGLNQAPDRSFLAFLDTMGDALLPAQSARAPLVFKLMENSPVDVPLPKDSLVAAPPQPNPPSPLLEDEAPAEEPTAILFATTQTITLTRARLAGLYSLQPASDEYADHLPQAETGFTFFEDLLPVEHAIYLGHDELFALAGEAEIRFSLSPGPIGPAQGPSDLEIEWQYLSKDGWLALEIQDDRTNNLANGGQLVLRKSCGPDSKEETIFGHTSYWLRGRLVTPLLPAGQSGAGALPSIDTLQARVGFVKSGLQPEAAFTDAFKVDTGNNFYPFGLQPVRYTTFYLGSKEVFQRHGARVSLKFTLSEAGVGSTDLSLSWDYHDGTEWRSLDSGFDFLDGTQQFTQSGDVSFLCPPDWAEAEVNGTKNFWLRVRINAGDYGHPLRLTTVPDNGSFTVEAEDSTLAPPVVAKLTLQYTYQTKAFHLDHCLTFNDFLFSDHTEDCRWLRRPFTPFSPVPDRQPAVYFAFDRPLPSGLVSMYMNIPAEEDGDSGEISNYIWEYRSARGWSELGVLDNTQGFRFSGLIQWIGARDAVPEAGVNGDLYRLRARLVQGERLRTPAIRGVWLNAVLGTQRNVFEREVLGTSSGTPGQTFSFLRRTGPILEGELVEVREWTGRGEGWQTAVQGLPEKDLRYEKDPVTQEILAVWVRWYPQAHLFSSGRDERHYILERSSGLMRFGDGQHGLIPPAGSRVSASYSSGGGLAGNLPAEAISELRTGVPYLQEVTNPAAAEGGAATELLAGVRGRGPQRLRHRDRALSPADYEWLARQASPGIARARCLPLTGPDGFAQRGWVSLVIIPHSLEAQPQPSDELVRRVGQHLAERAPASMAGNVRVLRPSYLPITVVAEVVAEDPEQAAQVEARLRLRLNSFLHPLTGGVAGAGWEFGEPIYLSQIARLVEETAGVDYAAYLGLRVGEQLYDEFVPVETLLLAAAGDHELKMTVGKD